MIDVRKDYAAAHPPEWTEKSVLAGHGYNTAGAALGVKSMAREIAAFRNAARDGGDGKWMERLAAEISSLYRKQTGGTIYANWLVTIIKRHAPGRAI